MLLQAVCCTGSVSHHGRQRTAGQSLLSPVKDIVRLQTYSKVADLNKRSDLVLKPNRLCEGQTTGLD